MGSSGRGSGSYEIRKKSQIRRRHRYPARMQSSARTSLSTSTVDTRSEAASRTAPPAVTHEWSGCGDRKKASDGCETWVSCTSTNQSSHCSKTSSARRSRRPSTQKRVSISTPEGGEPARTSSFVMSASRRENAP